MKDCEAYKLIWTHAHLKNKFVDIRECRWFEDE